jgi:hypothetical protein
MSRPIDGPKVALFCALCYLFFMPLVCGKFFHVYYILTLINSKCKYIINMNLRTLSGDV